MSFIKIGVQFDQFGNIQLAMNGRTYKNTTCKITPPGHKAQVDHAGGLQLQQRLTDLAKVLVGKCFISLDIIGAPAEMRSGGQRLSCPC